MTKYDEKFKIAVVHEYLAGGAGHKALAAKFGTLHSQTKRWVDSYRQRGENGLIEKFSHYSAEVKLSVLQHMWRDDLSFTQTAAFFDLRGGLAVASSWERNYHEVEP
jgi:transposase